jgi:hypothetical protein
MMTAEPQRVRLPSTRGGTCRVHAIFDAGRREGFYTLKIEPLLDEHDVDGTGARRSCREE